MDGNLNFLELRELADLAKEEVDLLFEDRTSELLYDHAKGDIKPIEPTELFSVYSCSVLDGTRLFSPRYMGDYRGSAHLQTAMYYCLATWKFYLYACDMENAGSVHGAFNCSRLAQIFKQRFLKSLELWNKERSKKERPEAATKSREERSKKRADDVQELLDSKENLTLNKAYEMIAKKISKETGKELKARSLASSVRKEFKERGILERYKYRKKRQK